LGDEASEKEKELLANKVWQNVEDHIPQDQRTPQIVEILDWVRHKALSGNLIILDPDSMPEGESKQKAEEMVRTVAAAYSLGGLSRLDPEQEDLLIIVPSIMSSNTSMFDFLAAMAHERGHELYNRYRDGMPISKTDTNVVFAEFFPFLEAQRFYSSLTTEQRSSLSERQDSFYNPEDKDLGGINFSGKMRGLINELNVPLDELSYMLAIAYLHGIENKNRTQKRDLASELAAEGMGNETINQKISELKAINTSVVHKNDINWEVIKSQN